MLTTPIGPDMTNRSPRCNRIGEGASLPRATTHPEIHVGFEAGACNHLRIIPGTKLGFVIAVPQEADPQATYHSRFTPDGSSFFKHQSVTKDAALLHTSMNLFQTESLNCGPIVAPRPYLYAQRQACLGVNFVQFNVQSTCTLPEPGCTA